jgi:hypothetical protein
VLFGHIEVNKEFVLSDAVAITIPYWLVRKISKDKLLVIVLITAVITVFGIIYKKAVNTM